LAVVFLFVFNLLQLVVLVVFIHLILHFARIKILVDFI